MQPLLSRMLSLFMIIIISSSIFLRTIDQRKDPRPADYCIGEVKGQKTKERQWRVMLGCVDSTETRMRWNLLLLLARLFLAARGHADEDRALSQNHFPFSHFLSCCLLSLLPHFGIELSGGPPSSRQLSPLALACCVGVGDERYL